jgi:hypothetical protein
MQQAFQRGVRLDVYFAPTVLITCVAIVVAQADSVVSLLQSLPNQIIDVDEHTFHSICSSLALL